MSPEENKIRYQHGTLHERRNALTRLREMVEDRKHTRDAAAYMMNLPPDFVGNLMTRHQISPLNPPGAGAPCRGENQLMPGIRLALAGRLKETSEGYRLDGVPIGFVALIREANAVRSEAGLEQIGRNPEWHVR